MSPSSLSVIQPLPNATGTPEFESKRKSILDEFASKVPQELRLPPSIIENPPKNVTGVPRECGLLTAREIEITEKYDAFALAQAIAAKQLTSVEVAIAFSKRAIIAHQLTCCLMEWFMDEAVSRAKELDDHLAKTGETVGPLHGVPISIKEHMSIAGHITTYGFLETHRKDAYDNQMEAILRRAGAVFFCKTIQPQSIMHLESVSIYGRVLNPYNINLSAGGSSGGEAALIAMNGSPLGVGTDIGGSIRCPSAFCGIYGFKATSETLPTKGIKASLLPAEINVTCSTGPMCNSLRDMELFMKVVKGAKPHLEDPRLVPIPWTGLETPKKTPLKIGFLMDDGDIKPQPPVTRALEWVQSQLGKHVEFELKPFKPFKTEELMKNIRLAVS